MGSSKERVSAITSIALGGKGEEGKTNRGNGVARESNLAWGVSF